MVNFSIKASFLQLVVYCLLFVCYANAQDKDSITTSQTPLDRSGVQLRYPSKEQLEKYKSDNDYQYDEDTKSPENPLAKFWYWLMQKINAFFTSKAYKSFWQYVILAGIAIMAIWYLLKSDYLGGLFGRKSQKNGLDYEVMTENIHEIDFEQSIEEAISQKNYRLATRLFYLKSLKHLSDQNKIDWKPTKTNRSYLYEILDNQLKSNFENITRQFEYVWYGDFNITEQQFLELKTDFQDFNSKM